MHALSVLWDALPFIVSGSLVTIANVAIALAIGLLMGVPLAVGQVYGGALIRRLAGLYVWFFRGVPILVLLFLFFGLFVTLDLPVEPFLISCAVLGCTSTAYQSQIFRGSMESIPAGQLKAARALGMHDALAIRTIIHSWLGQRVFHPAERFSRLLCPGRTGNYGPHQFCSVTHP